MCKDPPQGPQLTSGKEARIHYCYYLCSCQDIKYDHLKPAGEAIYMSVRQMPN